MPHYEATLRLRANAAKARARDTKTVVRSVGISPVGCATEHLMVSGTHAEPGMLLVAPPAPLEALAPPKPPPAPSQPLGEPLVLLEVPLPP